MTPCCSYCAISGSLWHFPRLAEFPPVPVRPPFPPGGLETWVPPRAGLAEAPCCHHLALALGVSRIACFDDTFRVYPKNIQLVYNWCCKHAGGRPCQPLCRCTHKGAAFPGEHSISPMKGCAPSASSFHSNKRASLKY